MSYVTDVLVQGALQRDIDKLNAWLAEHDERRPELLPMKGGGGSKVMGDVWGAAFNYLHDDFPDLLADPATWSISGVMWTIDHEGDQVAMGMYQSPKMFTTTFSTGGYSAERVVFEVDGQEAARHEWH